MTSPTLARRLGLAGGLAIKAPVRTVSLTNIVLSGLQTVNSVVLAAGDRCLIAGQTDATQNGWYDVDSGSWTRSIDANGATDVAKGTIGLITDGTYSGQFYVLNTAGTISFGTTAIAFAVGIPALAVLAAAGGSALVGFIQAGVGAVLRTVQDELRVKVNVKQFGAVGGATDDSAAYAAALTYVSSIGGGVVEIPNGLFSKITSTLLVPDYVTLQGAGKMASGIIVSADVVGIRLTGVNAGLRNLRITKSGAHTKNGVEVGDLTHNAREAILDAIYVSGMGNDGIQVRYGNLGTLRDVSSVSNTRHGIMATKETVDTNAWKLDGVIEVSTNGGKGFYLEPGAGISDPYAARSWHGGLIVSQTNTGYGVDIGTRSNTLAFYGESNGTYQCYLGIYASGNIIESVEGAVFDSTAGNYNMIVNPNANASYWREFQNKTLFAGGTGLGLRISNSDGAAGYIDHEKVGTRDYRIKLSGSADTWTYKIENTSVGQIVDGYIGGYWTPTIDVSYDLGKSALRWNNAYIATAQVGILRLSALASAGAVDTLNLGAQFSASASAGGGAAVPATVLGFILAYVGSTQVKIPYFAA